MNIIIKWRRYLTIRRWSLTANRWFVVNLFYFLNVNIILFFSANRLIFYITNRGILLNANLQFSFGFRIASFTLR